MLRFYSWKHSLNWENDTKTLGRLFLLRRKRNQSNIVTFAQDRVRYRNGIQEGVQKAIHKVLVNNSRLRHGIHFEKRKQSHRRIDSRDETSVGDAKETHVIARDPHLKQVLELASDQDLKEIYDCVHGVSVFSPLAKSIILHDSLRNGVIYSAEREEIEIQIESRFRFLAADCRHLLDPVYCRGGSETAKAINEWPSYRDTLLDIRKQYRVPCPGNLDTVDLESEIFLFLLSEHGEYVQHTRASALTSDHALTGPDSTDGTQAYPERVVGTNILTQSSQSRRGRRCNPRGNSMLKGMLFSPLSFVAQGETLPTLAKTAITLALTKTQVQVIQNLGHVVLKRAAYHKAITLLHGATTEVGTRVAIETAKQRLVGAAVQYTAWRQLFSFIGPILWISAAWDITKLSVGTDYARLTRTVFLLAQIRLLKTRGWH